jgi:hypothetical protein
MLDLYRQEPLGALQHHKIAFLICNHVVFHRHDQALRLHPVLEILCQKSRAHFFAFWLTEIAPTLVPIGTISLCLGPRQFTRERTQVFDNEGQEVVRGGRSTILESVCHVLRRREGKARVTLPLCMLCPVMPDQVAITGQAAIMLQPFKLGINVR